MDFNHLMTERSLRTTKCKGASDLCKWYPVNEGRTTIGGYVNLTMCCSRCHRREDIFLDSEKYKIHERLIKMEVKSV